MKTIKLLAIVAIIGLMFVSGCSKKDDHEGHNHGTSVSEGDAETIWTCSMHPEIRESEPGLCPKCNMKLIKAEK